MNIPGRITDGDVLAGFLFEGRVERQARFCCDDQIGWSTCRPELARSRRPMLNPHSISSEDGVPEG